MRIDSKQWADWLKEEAKLESEEINRNSGVVLWLTGLLAVAGLFGLWWVERL